MIKGRLSWYHPLLVLISLPTPHYVLQNKFARRGHDNGCHTTIPYNGTDSKVIFSHCLSYPLSPIRTRCEVAKTYSSFSTCLLFNL